jgi:D-tyrosyl-tRNA(Tyr) deacylase
LIPILEKTKYNRWISIFDNFNHSDYKLLMRAVIQRVRQSLVTVENQTVGKIGNGLLVFLGVAKLDGDRDADYLADKITNLRIFEDENGKMNRSLLEISGEMLVVSQFTLLGDCRKGRRPSFINAAGPDEANALYERFVSLVRQKGISIQTGQFQTMMAVSLINDGPVTLILESK